MQLSFVQKRQFFEQGFLLIPGVVPRVMVDAALRAINHSVGEGMAPDEMPIMRAQTYCREITQTPVISDLINGTPAFSLAESALEAGRVRPVKGGQIALRFPSLQDPPGVPRPHVDGKYSPNNGVQEGTISNFTMLAGVLLSDLNGPNCGNFTVWPGTHLLFEKYWRENGAESLLQGMPKVAMPEPLQITGKAGDLVLAHWATAHGVAPNVSPHVRYACFFRLKHEDHDSHALQTMTDIWMDWKELRATIDE
jgi:hypothetical protein